MITLFSTPRPFTGPFYDIQMNAIKSWLLLGGAVQVVLFEDEEGTTGPIAESLGLICIKDVQCNEFGTPLLSSVFEKVNQVASNDIICHINADIILNRSFLDGVKKVKELMGEKNFFMSGRRWDFNLQGKVTFDDTNWSAHLVKKAKQEGVLHGYSGMDYWMFPKKLDFSVPSFVIGRPGMDSWLVYRSHILGIPVIDATAVIDIIHQNHPYPKKGQDFFAIEKKRNLTLAGGFMYLMTLREASFLLTQHGLERPLYPIRFFSLFALFYPWRVIFYIKRKWDNIRGIW